MNGEKLIIFDLDGTLLDTLDDLCDSVNYVLEKNGFATRTRDEVRSFLGSGAEYLIRKSLPEDKLDEAFDTCFAEYKAYYKTHSQIKTKPYDGVLPLLKFLREKGYYLAVVSNKPHFAVEILCRDYFGDLMTVCTGEREGVARKPAPDAIFALMKELDCQNAIFVGDSEVDVMTAKNANIPSVIMTWGFRDREQLADAGAVNLADNAIELQNKIFEIFGEKY